MEKYEYIETGNTAVVDIDGKDPVFLNETASAIIKMHINGTSLEEIKNKLMKEYSIPENEVRDFENQVELTIRDFDNMIESDK
ncbi:PqqD family protein [Lysinibacillus sp. NPDC093210]|uniref:PqqD family protein n=1 Tax=Lysinibacillus sp. NPDC093210 TaxID=3364133 RepID=UPI00382E00E5